MHFGKGTRITSTDEIIKTAKKSKVGPGQYKIKYKENIPGVVKSTTRKSVGFIDDAEYKSKNMPWSYNIKDIRKRVLTPDFKRQSREREVKITKKAGLAPGAYKHEDSFNKTQVIMRDWVFLKGKRFVEMERKIKYMAYVPAPGHYSIDNAEKKVSKRFGPQRR